MSLKRRLGKALNVIAALLAVAIVATLGTAVYLSNLSKGLPDIEVDANSLHTPETSIVYAADGSVIAEWHGEEDRTIVPYAEMPLHLRDAVVAIEDRRFWEHDGVDFEGIMRALRANAEAGEVRQGGSTITQQLVKILFTEGERTFSRKVREALLAYELEARADKEQVLESYLNTVYFGNGAYGVESAAKHYFGKKTASLTLAEAALLAGVIRAPSRDDPTSSPDSALKRRNLVLAEMSSQGYITESDMREARRVPLELAGRRSAPSVAPYFVEYVKQDLINRLGPGKVYDGGLRVYTTLEPGIQKMAEKSARVLDRASDPEVAIAAVTPRDGRVIALVGGRDFAKSQFNLASQGRRQPGSAFKPFVLIAALEKGVRPQQKFDAAPFKVEVKDGVWNVQNYENTRTGGSVSLATATSWSVNAVYARLIMKLGPDRVVDCAKRLGITTPVNADPAIALGGLKTGVSPLEMAAAYGTIANDGLRVAPSGIVRVTDARGALVYEADRTAARAIARPVAVQASLMLHDVIEEGTGTGARIGTWAAGKTGTTQSYRDAWFVGWSGDVATAVWVGYPKAQVSMTKVRGSKVTGGSYPARIWASFMKQVTAERAEAVTPASEEGGQVLATVCKDSMQLANKRCPTPVSIYLAPSLVPKEVCTVH